MKVYNQKLKNGLRIITVPQAGAKSAVLFVFAGVGSGYEPEETAGISHFLEHLMFKGTPKRPTPLLISETIDSIGGSMNAFTGREHTGYYAKVNARHFDLALDWLSDIYLNANLTDSDIKREKKVILEELNMYLDMPMHYVDELWYQLLYGKHPLGRNIIGTRAAIRSMNQKHLKDYRSKHYHAGNTVIVLSGRVSPSSELTRKISKAFGSIESNRTKINMPALSEKQSHPGILVQYKKTDQTHFCLGARGYSLQQSERFPQAILATILGGNMSSRLFSLIREQNSLAYYIRTSADTMKDTGFIVTQAGVDNNRIQQAIAMVLSEYKRIKDESVPAEELRKAKEYLKGILWLSIESPENLAGYYAQFEILGLKPISPDEVCRQLDKVGAEDIRKLAKKIFRNESLNLALIGPSRSSQFKKILKIA